MRRQSSHLILNREGSLIRFSYQIVKLKRDTERKAELAEIDCVQGNWLVCWFGLYVNR